MPFTGLDDSDSEEPPNDGEKTKDPNYAEILTKTMENLTAQQNIVRKNMIFLTKQRAEQLYAKAREDLRAFDDDEGDVRQPKLPDHLLYEGPETETSEDYEYPVTASSPTTEHNDDGDIEMGGQSSAAIKLASEIKKLIEQSASELEGYDMHTKMVHSTYQEELERLGGNLANILKGTKGVVMSPTEIVIPTDHFRSPTRQSSSSTAFSPTVTSPSAVRTEALTFPAVGGSPNRGRKRGSIDDIVMRESNF